MNGKRHPNIVSPSDDVTESTLVYFMLYIIEFNSVVSHIWIRTSQNCWWSWWWLLTLSNFTSLQCTIKKFMSLLVYTICDYFVSYNWKHYKYLTANNGKKTLYWLKNCLTYPLNVIHFSTHIVTDILFNTYCLKSIW